MDKDTLAAYAQTATKFICSDRFLSFFVSLTPDEVENMEEKCMKEFNDIDPYIIAIGVCLLHYRTTFYEEALIR